MSENSDTGRTKATSLECVILGDSKVGKYGIVSKHLDLPSVENRAQQQKIWKTVVGSTEVNLDCSIILPAGSGKRFARFEYYRKGDPDVAILCFSLADRNTLKSAEDLYWEVTTLIRKLPIVLVGTHSDLRDNEDYPDRASLVTAGQGEELKQKLNAVAYIECSSITGENLQKVFETAADAGLKFYGYKKEHKTKPFACTVV